MKPYALAALSLWFSFSPGKAQTEEDLLKYSKTITAQDLKKHLSFLAGPECEGRGSGTRGQKKAAAYIMDHYKGLGVPGGNTKNAQNPYYQPYKFTTMRKGNFKFQLADGSEIHQDAGLGLIKNSPMRLSMDFVYAGTGTPEELAAAKCKDKTLVVFYDDAADATKVGALSKDRLQKMISTAETKLAKGLILVRNKVDNISGAVTDFDLCIGKSDSKLPVMVADRATGLRLLAKTEESFAAALAKKSPMKQKVKTVDEFLNRSIEAENVLAFIEGTDKKDEVIVISAHFDHMGVMGGEIYFGADDDGSGTVTVMEIAEAFAQAKKEGKGPRRSILFLHVSGEELGLHGSAYYADKEPVYSLSNTVANLNVDMVGRVDRKHEDDPNYIYIIGSDMLSNDLHKLSEGVRDKYFPKFEYDYKHNTTSDPEQYYYRSDHYNFAKNKIPVIFYFSGTHPDYHKPTDTVDKIMFDKMATVGQLIFTTAWELANRDERIKLTEKK